MNKWLVIGGIAVVVLAGLGTGGWFYWQKTHQPKPPGMSAEDRAKLQAYYQSHTQGTTFETFLGDLVQVETRGTNALTADQAKKILAILDPLSRQKTMSEDDARQGQIKVNGVLTDAQTSEIQQIQKSRPARTFGQGGGAARQPGAGGTTGGNPSAGGGNPSGGNPGGGPPVGGGGMRGGGNRPPGMNGGRPGMDVNAIIGRPFNPLSVSSRTINKQMDYLMKELDAKANGKPLPEKPQMGQGRRGGPGAGTPQTGGATAPGTPPPGGATPPANSTTPMPTTPAPTGAQ
jgi:hypothetical protein